MNRHERVISDRKVRFAVVGCGRISKNHFDALNQHAARAEVVAVCDTDAAVLDRAVKQTGARGYRSLEAMLSSSSDIDCVVLTSPSGLIPHKLFESQIQGFMWSRRNRSQRAGMTDLRW